jgi:hydrogenase maturation factor
MLPGKLDPELLQELISSSPIDDDRVVLRPGVGRDVCAIRMEDRYLVAKTDPITFATDRIGWYVVHINANDIATVGAVPRWFLCTALLPEGQTDEALVRSIWKDLQTALRNHGCTLVGGHTEITVGLDRPILIGHMLGEVGLESLVDKSNIVPGDRVLLTKGVPIEGTALMARERPEKLVERFDEDTLERARDFLDDPGIDVLPEALAAVAAGDVHGMHDPTEGGVATGLWELAQAAGTGLRIDADAIPLMAPGRDFCEVLGLDPLGTIASGSLIICVPADDAASVISAVEMAGVDCCEIGEVVPKSEGIKLRRDGNLVDMPTFPSDEITKLFAD